MMIPLEIIIYKTDSLISMITNKLFQQTVLLKTPHSPDYTSCFAEICASSSFVSCPLLTQLLISPSVNVKSTAVTACCVM